ncbi:hypothetical protein V1478_017274, partial [Vespula squamosa]
SEEIVVLGNYASKIHQIFSFSKRDDSRERKRSGNELIAESEIGRQLLRSMTHDDYIQTLTTARQQIDIAPLPNELEQFLNRGGLEAIKWEVQTLVGVCTMWEAKKQCESVSRLRNAKTFMAAFTFVTEKKFTFRTYCRESSNPPTFVPKVNLSRFRTSMKSFSPLRACKFPPAWFRSSRLYSHSPEAERSDDGSAAGTGPPRRRNSLKEPAEAPSHLLNIS